MKSTNCGLLVLFLLLLFYSLAIYFMLLCTENVPMRMLIVIGVHIITITLLIGIIKHWPNLIERELNERNYNKISEVERKAWNENINKLNKTETDVELLKQEIKSLTPLDVEHKEKLLEFFKEAMRASVSTSIIIDNANNTTTNTSSAVDVKNVKSLVEEYSKFL